MLMRLDYKGDHQVFDRLDGEISKCRPPPTLALG